MTAKTYAQIARPLRNGDRLVWTLRGLDKNAYVGTVIGYQVERYQEQVMRALNFGDEMPAHPTVEAIKADHAERKARSHFAHEWVWINQEAVSLTAGCPEQKRLAREADMAQRIRVEPGQIVALFDGERVRRYLIERAPNDNLALIEQAA